jgi:hypothetical protein
MAKRRIKKVDAAAVREHTTLTANIMNIKKPSNFLFDLCFSRHQSLSTEKAEIGIWTGNRLCAPFVRKNGEARLVGGRGNEFQTVDTPHCRIKMAIQPGDVVFQRQPGSEIFSSADQVSGANFYYGVQQTALMDMIAESEEWLAAQALRMQISYVPDETEDVFQVTFPRAAGHTTTASVDWDEADKDLVEIEEDFLRAANLVSEAIGLGVTHCFLGSLAALHFRKTLKKQAGLLDYRDITAGRLDYVKPWLESGARPIGMLCGIEVWEYSRQTTDHTGTAKNLIRSKYAEFVAVTPANEFTTYYGGIADVKTLGQGRLHIGERFSKAWLQDDPSVEYILAASRPLPCPRRADATVSMKVVSGANPAAG